jgi:hypothetical protein
MGLKVDVGDGEVGGRAGISASPAERRPGGMHTLQAPTLQIPILTEDPHTHTHTHIHTQTHTKKDHDNAGNAGNAGAVSFREKKNILPLDMAKIDMAQQTQDQSFDFTESGTLNIQDFKINKRGIKATPFDKMVAGENGEADIYAQHKHAMPSDTSDCLIQLGELGQGAGGKVYKALYVPTLKLVAVKVIRIHEQAKRRQMIQGVCVCVCVCAVCAVCAVCVPCVPCVWVYVCACVCGGRGGSASTSTFTSLPLLLFLLLFLYLRAQVPVRQLPPNLGGRNHTG